MQVQETDKIVSSAVTLIAPEILGYTRLYLDFVNRQPPACDFYPAGSLETVADEIDRREFDRQAIVDLLKKQNRIYGASEAAMANIENLLDPTAVCVFAGQQAGLYGGPLLTVIKALGVVKAARRYADRLSRPVVPIFWIAGDDHDFEEANHTFVLSRAGELCRIAYQNAPEKELPTAEIMLNDAGELERLRGQMRECLGETDFTPELLDLLERCYTTEDTLVTAFAKLMAALTVDLGLVLFSPGDVAAKKLGRPFFKSIVERQSGLSELLAEANGRLEAAGYHIQVEKKDNAVHIFYNHGGRRPILRDGNRFVVGDESFSKAELLAQIDSAPERFSPDVMTRPLFQSYLFPTLSQKGGPAEIAYLAQLNPLFGLFDLPAPVHPARPTVTVLENRFEQQMKQMGIAFEELPGDIEQVINRVLAKSFPENLDRDFNQLRDTIETGFKRLIDEALDFEPGMQKYAEQVYGKVDFQIKGFEAKVFAAHKKKSQETRDRIYRINNALYPNHGLQERTLNITYLLARYGRGIIKYLFDRMDGEEISHQVISLGEYR